MIRFDLNVEEWYKSNDFELCGSSNLMWKYFSLFPNENGIVMNIWSIEKCSFSFQYPQHYYLFRFFLQ